MADSWKWLILFFVDFSGKIFDGPPLKKAKIDGDLKVSTVGGNSPTKYESYKAFLYSKVAAGKAY